MIENQPEPKYPRGPFAVVLAVAGVVAIVVAVVLLLVHLTGAGIIVGIVGVILVVAGLFRRFGRPGDFRHSGWTGS